MIGKLNRTVGIRGAARACVSTLVGALLVMLGTSACRDGESADVIPTPTIEVLSPSEATIMPTPPAPDTAFLLVFQEFGATEDKIWRLSPKDPMNREQLATIAHPEGTSVRPSLSPDSLMIAYISVPEGALDPSYQGDLYTFDLTRQETKLVQNGVDYRFRPLWSTDGRLLFVWRFLGMEVGLLMITIPREPLTPEPTPVPTPTPTPSPEPTPVIEYPPTATPVPTPVVETPTPMPTPVPTLPPEEPIKNILQAHMGSVLTFIPVGFGDDGKSIYFVQVQGGTGGGTWVASYAPATTEALAGERAKVTPIPPPPPDAPPVTPAPTPVRTNYIVQLSDQIVREFDLSPDRKRLSFLAQGIVEGQFVMRSFIADIGGKTAAPLPGDGLPAGDHFRPLWHPDSTRVAVGLLPSALETGAVALVPIAGGVPIFLPAPERGFDVPASWAPDGSYLAVTNYSGDSLANPGDQRIDLVAPTGHRLVIAEGSQYDVVGWFSRPEPQPTPSPS